MVQYLPFFNFSAERAAEPDFLEQPSKCVAARYQHMLHPKQVFYHVSKELK
jgi:hypothetical protein